MNPIIIDKDTGKELWTSTECADHVGVVNRSWLTYVNTKQAPQSVAHINKRTLLWDADEVKTWAAGRPKASKA